ncbi:MAG TPA: hypothetical protein VJ385_14235 [Fibrobacteria bacterium]|nr:hypothetical protein [Fibrobacteria bacterium]
MARPCNAQRGDAVTAHAKATRAGSQAALPLTVGTGRLVLQRKYPASGKRLRPVPK